MKAKPYRTAYHLIELTGGACGGWRAWLVGKELVIFATVVDDAKAGLLERSRRRRLIPEGSGRGVAAVIFVVCREVILRRFRRRRI